MILRILVIALFLAVSFTIGYVVGARDGVYQNDLLNSSVRASLLVSELKVLKKGEQSSLISSKEIELDNEIAKFSIMNESGRVWVLWPESEVFEHDRYMSSVVEYRLANPSRYDQDFISELVGEELKKKATETATRVQQVIDQYNSKKQPGTLE